MEAQNKRPGDGSLIFGSGLEKYFAFSLEKVSGVGEMSIGENVKIPMNVRCTSVVDARGLSLVSVVKQESWGRG